MSLTKDQVAQALDRVSKGESKAEVAASYGVTPAAIAYHVRKAFEGGPSDPDVPARYKTPFGSFELSRADRATPYIYFPYEDSPVAESTAQAARVTVSSAALDVDDARQLLSALGLLPLPKEVAA